MLSKIKTVFFIGLFLGYSNQLYAEPSLNQKPQTINLQDAVSKAFEHNPALQTLKVQLEAQKGQVIHASQAASPKAGLMVENALGTGAFDGVENAQVTLSIAWVLEGETRQSLTDVAQAGSLSLAEKSAVKRLDVAAETTRLYLNCLAIQSRMANVNKTVELATETVLAITKRVRAGKTPEAELLRAQAEVERRYLDYEDLEHELSSAIRLLAAQWGDTNPEFTQVEGNLSVLPETISYEMLKAQFRKSPSFTLLLSEKRLRQAELKLAEAQSNSNWDVNIGVRHDEANGNQALVAGITIPFGERSRNRGRIIEKRANLSKADIEEEALRVSFETTLYVLYQELQHSLHRIEAYRSEIIPRLENALKETRSAYLLGRYSYFEWRSVQAELLDARSALIESSIDTHLKAIEIERLTGVHIVQPITEL